MERHPELLTRVDSALRSHPHLRSVLVKSEQQRDRVILSGNVNSFFVKQMAQEALRDVDGIAEIENRLEVVYY
jgi:osmotically-inducible protein OsmY